MTHKTFNDTPTMSVKELKAFASKNSDKAMPFFLNDLNKKNDVSFAESNRTMYLKGGDMSLSLDLYPAAEALRMMHENDVYNYHTAPFVTLRPLNELDIINRVLKKYPVEVVEWYFNKNNGGTLLAETIEPLIAKEFIGTFFSVREFLDSYFGLRRLESAHIGKNYSFYDFFDVKGLSFELQHCGDFVFVPCGSKIHAICRNLKTYQKYGIDSL